MKKLLTLLILLACELSFYAKCSITCNVRYEVRSNAHAGTYAGDQLGETTIFAPDAVMVGGGKSWSQFYKINVTFYSGYEYNKEANGKYFDDYSIIAVVSWNNGGYSTIELYKWKTNMPFINENEVTYNTTTKEKIPGVSGVDSKGNNWEIYF